MAGDRDAVEPPEYAYKVVHHDAATGEYPLEDVLNNYGAKGWRYVGDVDDSHVVLERLEEPAVHTRVETNDRSHFASGLFK